MSLLFYPFAFIVAVLLLLRLFITNVMMNGILRFWSSRNISPKWALSNAFVKSIKLYIELNRFFFNLSGNQYSICCQLVLSKSLLFFPISDPFSQFVFYEASWLNIEDEYL